MKSTTGTLKKKKKSQKGLLGHSNRNAAKIPLQTNVRE